MSIKKRKKIGRPFNFSDIVLASRIGFIKIIKDLGKQVFVIVLLVPRISKCILLVLTCSYVSVLLYYFSVC